MNANPAHALDGGVASQSNFGRDWAAASDVQR